MKKQIFISLKKALFEYREREGIDVVNDIKKVFVDNNYTVPENESEKVKNLIEEYDNIIKNNRKVVKTFLFILVILFSIVGYFINDYININTKIEAESFNKDMEIINLKGDLRVLNSYVFGQETNPDTSKSLLESYSPIVRNGKVVKYSDLSKLIDSLQNKVYDLEFKIQDFKNKIDIIKEVFDISIDDKYNIHSERVDSALRLLPVFKSKMRFDNKTGNWIINY